LLKIRLDIENRAGVLKSLVRQSSLQFDIGLVTERHAAAEALIDDAHGEDEQDLKATSEALIVMVAAQRGDIELGIRNLLPTIETWRRRYLRALFWKHQNTNSREPRQKLFFTKRS
jgi:hypothetical protein